MTLRQSDSPIDTTPRANAEQIGLALKFLGVRKVEVTGSLVTATHSGITVNIRLCRDNIPFVWWTEDGEQRLGSSVRDAVQALGVGGYVSTTTILTRAMKSLGLSNRKTDATHRQDFYVHGEYKNAGGGHKERVRTLADFRSRESGQKAADAWETLKPALDLTGYVFQLCTCGSFYYVSN